MRTCAGTAVELLLLLLLSLFHSPGLIASTRPRGSPTTSRPPTKDAPSTKTRHFGISLAIYRGQKGLGLPGPLGPRVNKLENFDGGNSALVIGF